MPNVSQGQSVYEGAVQQDCEKFLSLLGAHADTDRFDIQAFMLRSVCESMRLQGMADESIALYEEMYTRICEENGPADPVPKALSLDLQLADSGGDLIERSVGFSG
jgi:hypothetical protein